VSNLQACLNELLEILKNYSTYASGGKEMVNVTLDYLQERSTFLHGQSIQRHPGAKTK
jgi:hypothetical protein